MKLGQVLAGISLTGETPTLDMEINSISYDSRRLQPGALFVALPGAKEDGAQFIAQARERGAVGVVCRERPQDPGPWIITPDPRRALAQISANWFGHPGKKLTLIGVTGTNGKTTTACLIQEMLERVLHTKVGLIGTIYNEVGAKRLPAHRTTPESYELQELLSQMVEEGCSHVVMEVSSHGLVQGRVEGLTFEVGVFTNLTQDHLDYHHTMESYREAKEGLLLQSRRGVLNLDDPAGRWYYQRHREGAFTYSERRDQAHLTAKNVRLFPSYVEFEGVCQGEIQRVHLPIPGGFTIYNALAALSCGLCLQLPFRKLAQALSWAKGVKGRVEVVPTPGDYTLLIDYAHTPNALEQILLTVRGFASGRVLCLFGCGGDRDREKRPMMGGIAEDLSDVIVVTSDNPRTEPPCQIIQEILAGMEGKKEIHVEPDRAKAIAWALDQGRSGDVILLTGKGHETYQEIQGVQYPMDEREIVARYFADHQGRQETTGNISSAVV